MVEPLHPSDTDLDRWLIERVLPAYAFIAACLIAARALGASL